MGVLSDLPADRSGGRDDVRSRLAAMWQPPQAAGGAGPGSAPGDGAAAGDGIAAGSDTDPGADVRDEPGAEVRAEPGAEVRDGRLVTRWLPGSLLTARWDPGRPGALMLSVVAALAAVLAAVGVWWQRPVPEPVPALPVVDAQRPVESSAAPPAAPRELVVSVVGRVARPGLVHVPDGARVADALDAAGGAAPGTDLLGLNLARKLADGEQLLVGVAPPPGQPVDTGTAVDTGGGAAPDPAGAGSVVDLNAATLEQLDALPGVGPVTAQRILDWRSEHGRFTSVEQLREISGIGEAKYAKLKDLVRV